VGNDYERRPCATCGGTSYYLYPGESCFDCDHAKSPYAGGAPLVLIDAGGENSPHPQRIIDGTSHINLGLPPVATGVGESRPVTHVELGSNWGVREYAKRHGVEPMSRGRYRGLR
jgi:hypothetical protein